MTMLRLDHLAISCGDLASGTAFVQAALGVPMAAGGKHPHMATHNRLLGLGDLYLEVIAADPDAPAPPHPRWFDLDRFNGAPRLTNWIVACDDMEAALATMPDGTGTPVALERGDFRWRMAVPATGQLPHDDASPALIQWQGPHHPAPRLADQGVRLTRLTILHPQAKVLEAAIFPLLPDPRVAFEPAARKSMIADFSTPSGPRQIGG